MNAPRLVLNVLIAFGTTVLIVRVFLELTGYPRLGNSTLHIAHLLYGGIVMTAACLLMLIFATPTTYRIGSIMTGIGLGLFFDEVGKFITSNNDYFYKPAAPIIYMVSLIITFLFVLLRRRANQATDEEWMVDALEDGAVLLEGRQTEHQHRHIDIELDHIINNLKDPDYVKLAKSLHEFADSEAVRPGQSHFQLIVSRNEQWLLRQFIRRENVLTIILFVILALNSVSSLIEFTISAILPTAAPALAHQIENLFVSAGLRAFSPFSLSINDVDLLLNVITAVITLGGIIIFVTRHKQRGLFWIELALILNLCVVNVFTFYTEQFSAVLFTLANLLVLLYVRAYHHQLKMAYVHQLHTAAGKVDSNHPAGMNADSQIPSSAVRPTSS
jgi:hypothetical protein